MGAKYKKDRKSTILGDIQWDYQYDVVTVFEKGGGDCNSLNRIFQVWQYMNGNTAYLVTFTCTHAKNNHTTCIYKQDGKYYTCDYGGPPSNPRNSIVDCITAVAGVNGIDRKHIISYAVQDINWKII